MERIMWANIYTARCIVWHTQYLTSAVANTTMMKLCRFASEQVNMTVGMSHSARHQS